ncbi:hypothetical protein FRC17_005571, partial [Serendipita sp. 399]
MCVIPTITAEGLAATETFSSNVTMMLNRPPATSNSNATCIPVSPTPIATPDPSVQTTGRKDDLIGMVVLVPIFGWIPLVMLCYICNVVTKKRRAKQQQQHAAKEKIAKERTEGLRYES